VEIAEYIDALRDHGALLAGAAERAGLDTAVPPCSPWVVKDLLRHTGYVHRWATRHIAECPPCVLDGPPEAEILRGGAPDPDLIAWFLAGHAALVGTLAAADPALECATFMDAPSSLAFWARRQAHETAIHRADAESALGATPDYPAEFAVDGIDELLMGFGRRRKYQPAAGAESGRLRVVAADTGDAWSVEASEGRLQPRRDPGTAGNDAAVPRCTVSGSASGVYLYLWNRLDAGQAGVTITGDPALLASWQASVRVRWS
jgi:uncharacterized protein (TIGR03083 family)